MSVCASTFSKQMAHSCRPHRVTEKSCDIDLRGLVRRSVRAKEICLSSKSIKNARVVEGSDKRLRTNISLASAISGSVGTEKYVGWDRDDSKCLLTISETYSILGKRDFRRSHPAIFLFRSKTTNPDAKPFSMSTSSCPVVQSGAMERCQPAVFGNWPCPADRPAWLKSYLEAPEVERPWNLYGSRPGEVIAPVRSCPPDPKTGAIRFYSAFHQKCIDQRTPSPTWSPVYGSDPSGPFYVDSSYPVITDSRYYVPQVPYY
jgi:hypothetical protein